MLLCQTPCSNCRQGASKHHEHIDTSSVKESPRAMLRTLCLICVSVNLDQRLYKVALHRVCNYQKT